jgi:RNA polymerase sigma-70 factor (ECF subfamily)
MEVSIHADMETHVDSALNPEEQAAAAQRQTRLESIVRALPEQDRCCLALRAEGLRYREIAEILGVSLGSVSGSLARSLGRLARGDQG